MDLRRSVRIRIADTDKEKKKRKCTGNNDEISAKKTRKKEKVAISNDVLRLFLGWVPLESLPNVTLANRRFWIFGDESLEDREREIYSLYTISQIEQMGKPVRIEAEFAKRGKLVELAEVEPPKKFRVKSVHIEWMGRGGFQKRVLDLLNISKSLFVGAKLVFDWTDLEMDFEFIDELFAYFSFIEVYADSTLTEYFFSRTSIMNCNNLEIQSIEKPTHFEPSSLFDWLHTPSELGPNQPRQLCLNSSHTHDLRELLKKRFKDDTSKHKYIVRIRVAACAYQEFRIENDVTEEVLFMRRIEADYKVCYDFIRCPIGEEDSIKYIDHQ